MVLWWFYCSILFRRVFLCCAPPAPQMGGAFLQAKNIMRKKKSESGHIRTYLPLDAALCVWWQGIDQHCFWGSNSQVHSYAFCHLLLYLAVHFRFLLLPRPICCDGRLRAPYPHVSSLASFKHGVILPHRFHGNGCTTNMIFHIFPQICLPNIYIYMIYVCTCFPYIPFIAWLTCFRC